MRTLKAIFARHGVPSVLFSDNGPQFNSTAFKEFSSQYHFQHVTSSPRYPQSNGLAERTVKTVKALLTGNSNPQLPLLNYRATPLPWCSISPAELLFGCKIATNLPQTDGQLSPDWLYLTNLRQADSAHKSKQQVDFNRRHRTRPLPELTPSTSVWVRTGKQLEPGRVITKANAPRSYIVETATGRKHRNRHHLAPRLQSTNNEHFRFDTSVSRTISPESLPVAQPYIETTRSPIKTRSVTGTAIRLPHQYT